MDRVFRSRYYMVAVHLLPLICLVVFFLWDEQFGRSFGLFFVIPFYIASALAFVVSKAGVRIFAAKADLYIQEKVGWAAGTVVFLAGFAVLGWSLREGGALYPIAQPYIADGDVVVFIDPEFAIICIGAVVLITAFSIVSRKS